MWVNRQYSNDMSIYDDRKRHNPEVHEWCFHMINDPEYFEQWRFKDTIDEYNMIIGECQKQYDNTPATTTENLFTRATSLATIKRAFTCTILHQCV